MITGMPDNNDNNGAASADVLERPEDGGAVLDPRSLAARYVALWNEPDSTVRRAMIQNLWTSAGEHLLDPPQQLRQPARALGFDTAKLEIRGHAAIETRAATAYEEFVAPGDYVFRPRDNAARLRNVVKFNWEMVSTGTGEVAGGGLEVLELDDQGRIVRDYQFVD